METSSSSTRSSTRAAASKAGDASRKRKRGALQDISNNSKKLSQTRVTSRRSGVQKEADDASKPKTRPARASARTKSSSSTALGSRAPTAASKAKKRGALDKKSDGRAKKRRIDGAENQPPHAKVQTSMLSFQNPKPKLKKSEVKKESEQDKENVEVKPQIVKALEQQAKKQKVKHTQPQVKTEAADDNQHEEEAQEVQVKSGAVQPEAPETQIPAADTAPLPQNQRDEFAPRPYMFTFDHRNSCFDEETYAESVLDIDTPSAAMSSHMSKLVRELDGYYRKHEIKYLPEADYIGTVQLDINEKMRTILVDWLVEVGEEYELDSQTFHKAVNLVDRCLKKIKINRKQFQLLGCACMMIAAKFEEVYGPNVEEFVYISDQTYTAEEMLEMEAKVLNALEYRVASTTCYGFVHRYSKAGCTSDKQRSLVKYLCDFSLLFYHMVKFKPSKLVASAVYLARLMTGETEPWTPTLHHVTKYNPFDVQDCVEELHRLHGIEFQVVSTQRDKAKAVSEKYLADKFHSASTIPSCDYAALTDSFTQYMPS